jgi:Tfp pilus assembly PilM family ATPase/Tfp pilus assembly protein PilN
MSHLLAFDWSQTEARVATASLRGRRVVVEQAFSLPLEAGATVAEQIGVALAEKGLTRGDALVAAPRTSIEVRQFQLPAAPDEELPEMVRFQAMREFSELGDDWRLDYVPMDNDPTGPRTVLAAAIGPEPIGRLEAACEARGLKARRLVLRPYSAAALLARSRPGRPDEVRLLIDLLADEAELTVVLGQTVIFLRAARLSTLSREANGTAEVGCEGDPPPAACNAADLPDFKALVAEIRRTLAAVQNQWGGRKVDSIVFYGQQISHGELARSIEHCLHMPVTVFDPFEGLTLGRALQGARPEHPGRFGAVLGMLAAELEQTGHAVDFLNPRRPPKPPSQRKRFLWAGVAAAVLVVGWIVYARVERALLASEVQALQQRLSEVSSAAEHADKVLAKAAEIAKWADGEVVWLDQLRSLSEAIPPAEDAILGQVTIGPLQDATVRKMNLPPGAFAGKMELKGAVRKADVAGAMEKKLQSEGRRVVAPKGHTDEAARPYVWRFENMTVIVPKEAPP